MYSDTILRDDINYYWFLFPIIQQHSTFLPPPHRLISSFPFVQQSKLMRNGSSRKAERYHGIGKTQANLVGNEMREKKNMCRAFCWFWGNFTIQCKFYGSIRIRTQYESLRVRENEFKVWRNCTARRSWVAFLYFYNTKNERKLPTFPSCDCRRWWELCELTSSIRNESTGRNGQNNKTHTKGKSLGNEILFSPKFRDCFLFMWKSFCENPRNIPANRLEQ